jgi:hypothetical protein
MDVCVYVVPKYIGEVIIYAPLTVRSLLCLCNVFRSVYVDLIYIHGTKTTAPKQNIEILTNFN